jgi:hypothetical protein
VFPYSIMAIVLWVLTKRYARRSSVSVAVWFFFEAHRHLIVQHLSCFPRLRGSLLQSRLSIIVRFILQLIGNRPCWCFSPTSNRLGIALVGVFHQQVIV